MDAIRPDEDRGEPPRCRAPELLPADGSSAAVRFKTVKRVQATSASHLNFVAADTGSWEQAAATQPEMAASVACAVLRPQTIGSELNIPYEFYGQPRTYEPDFVVRMADGLICSSK